MNELDVNSLLIIIGLICITVEILLGAVTGFDLLLIGLIFMTGGAVGQHFDSSTYALVVIIALSFIYVAFARNFIKNKLKIETKPTNADGFLGKTGKVTKKITKDHAGQVKVDGEIWRAASHVNLEVGDIVVVQSISGVTVAVAPSKS